jgi:hypothetical protein
MSEQGPLIPHQQLDSAASRLETPFVADRVRRSGWTRQQGLHVDAVEAGIGKSFKNHGLIQADGTLTNRGLDRFEL